MGLKNLGLRFLGLIDLDLIGLTWVNLVWMELCLRSNELRNLGLVGLNLIDLSRKVMDKCNLGLISNSKSRTCILKMVRVTTVVAGSNKNIGLSK